MPLAGAEKAAVAGAENAARDAKASAPPPRSRDVSSVRPPDSGGSFQTEGRGIVEPDVGMYVVRDTDDALFERLLRGEPCHLLAPRQIGKSSLRVRTQKQLRARGVRCASLDLTSIGSGASADEWYFSVAAALVEELGLPDELDALWTRHRRMSAVRRFRQFLHEMLLGDDGPAYVVFLDEIDVTLSLPFSRDDFFGLIRATHQARASDPRWARLTFCLIGVAAPVDLVADPERTPFNTSFAVRIDDFNRDEARTFLPGLSYAGGDPEKLLDAVIDWTGGHPALTQRLCYWLTLEAEEGRDLDPGERVAALVRRLFLSSGRIDDPILLDAERRFAGDRPDARIPVMLHLYQRLLDGEAVPVDGNNPRQFGLRIAGLAAERAQGGLTVLRVRNRIFREVFNRTWVEEKLARRFLTEPLQIWKDSGKKDDHVLRGGALDIALAWATGREDVTPDERDFLQASQAVSRREQHGRQQAEIDRTQRERAEQQVRSQRRVVSLLTLTMLLVAVLLVFALRQYQKAENAVGYLSVTLDNERKAKQLLEAEIERRKQQLTSDAGRAQEELDAAKVRWQEALEKAKAAREEADAAKREADAARGRSKSSAYNAWRASELAAAATKKADDAAVLEIKAHNAEAAVSTARKRREAAAAAADQVSAMVGADDSVLTTVQEALTNERTATARLQENLHHAEADRDKARAELEVQRTRAAQLQETVDRLTRERDVARESAAPRFATPPPAGTPSLPSRTAPGPDADIYN